MDGRHWSVPVFLVRPGYGLILSLYADLAGLEPATEGLSASRGLAVDDEVRQFIEVAVGRSRWLALLYFGAVRRLHSASVDLARRSLPSSIGPAVVD
jgi:hypothetical protein